MSEPVESNTAAAADTPALPRPSPIDAGHLPHGVRPPTTQASPTPHVLQVIYPSPLEAFRSLMTIIVVALFVLTFILQPFRIPSESMERTLLVGDFLLVNKTIYGPVGHWHHLLPYKDVSHGDIVVFHFPLNPPEHVVKRVIGVPGDRIRFHNGAVYRNGVAITEPYAVYESAEQDTFRDEFPGGGYTNPGIDPHWFQRMRSQELNGELIVPAGKYFVLGDNRNHSRDSRYWGFVPQEDIVGRPFLIYFSLRQPSTTDLPELPQVAAGPSPSDKLGHEEVADRIADFARWSRILRIVR